MSTPIDHLKIPKFLLTFVGLNPICRFRGRKVYVCIVVSLNLLFWQFAINFLMRNRHDITNLAPVLESITHYVHWMGKFIAISTNQPRLEYLLTSVERFWTAGKFSDKDLSESCGKLMNNFVQTAKTLVFLGNLVMILFFMKSLLANNGELPILCDIPESLPSWFGFLQYPLDVVMAQTAMQMEVLFMLLCGGCVIQTKLLRYAYNQLDFVVKPKNSVKDIKRKLNELLQHQAFILKYCSEIGHLVTFGFFSIYAVGTLSACFELYLIGQLNVPIYIAARGLIYVFTITLELSFYCITAEYLSSQIQQIALSIYNTNWYESQSNATKKQIVLALLSIQTTNNFKAGGIITIDMPTFCQVFKTTFSVYTCLKAVTVK